MGDIGQILDVEIGPTKVFVVEARAAMLFHKPGCAPGGADAGLAVTWTCPTTLKAVERNSAECYTAALESACAQSYDPLVDRSFPRQVDVVCTDAHPSNLKAERMRSVGHPLPVRLHLLCDAHKGAAVATKMFSLWKELPSRVIQLALATKGAISVLRRHFREIIAEDLRISGGAAHRDALDHRTAMVRMFLPEYRPKEAARKVIILDLFNGDWRIRNSVQHHQSADFPWRRCSNPSCIHDIWSPGIIAADAESFCSEQLDRQLRSDHGYRTPPGGPQFTAESLQQGFCREGTATCT